jgi:hypothetical protein
MGVDNAGYHQPSFITMSEAQRSDQEISDRGKWTYLVSYCSTHPGGRGLVSGFGGFG